MKSYYSSNNSYRIDAHEDGHYSLNVHDPNFGIFIKDDSKMIELFALLCQFITEEVLQGWDWLVSDYRETDKPDQPDDNGADWAEDDVPF